MTWHAALALNYTREAGRTLARFQHSGPLRVLQSLYPEGPGDLPQRHRASGGRAALAAAPPRIWAT